MKEIIQEGKTREEALALALEQLGVSEDQVEIQELPPQKDRFFGLLTSKGVRLRVIIVESEEPAAPSPSSSDQEFSAASSGEASHQIPETLVKEFIQTILGKMNVLLDIDIETEGSVMYVCLSGEDSGMVIGKFGQTLDSLQYLANVMIGKKTRNKYKVVLNVGDYRQRREASLRRMAKAMAFRVIKSKKRIILAPMPPQDRRIVHMALSEFKHIATISEGVGPDRHVTIEYKDQ